MKKNVLYAGALALLIGATSCSHRLTDFTIISTKNIPIGKEAASLKKADQRVKGVDKTHTVLFIPLGTPNMKEAIDKAIEKYPGAVGLVDGVLKSQGWSILVYGQSSFVVEGTPLYESDLEDDEAFTVRQARQVAEPVTEPRQEFTEPSDSVQGKAMVFTHEVQDGETITSIAKAYGVTAMDIIRWNKLSSSKITKGTQLKIYVK